jgi:hypothetical protein
MTVRCITRLPRFTPQKGFQALIFLEAESTLGSLFMKIKLKPFYGFGDREATPPAPSTAFSS